MSDDNGRGGNGDATRQLQRPRPRRQRGDRDRDDDGVITVNKFSSKSHKSLIVPPPRRATVYYHVSHGLPLGLEARSL